MIEEAGTPHRLLTAEQAVGAGAHREGAEQLVERLPDGVGVGVWTEVLGAFAPLAPHHPGPGPPVGPGDRQVGVALVVPEPDVESGPVLLDQRVLEHDRRHLAVGDDPVHVGGGIDHRLGPRLEVAGEVGDDPLAERIRLAHIEHPAVTVTPQIGTRGIGDGRGDWSAASRPRGYWLVRVAQASCRPDHGGHAIEVSVGVEQRDFGSRGHRRHQAVGQRARCDTRMAAALVDASCRLIVE